MNVLISDDVHPVLEQRLTEAGLVCRKALGSDYDELLTLVQDFDALVVRSKVRIDRAFIDRAPRLRCIGRTGAGMETIDVDYASRKGIRCVNSPEGNRDAVGEHTLGLLLSLFDKICVADGEVRRGLWQREANRGLEVKGRTVGIIGFGNMGSAFAQRLRGFECEVLAYDKYRPAGYAPQGVEACTLESLMARADVVSLHVPLTDETRHMVDDRFLRSFSHPFFLLNTSRGAVVDTPALADALERGWVLGAGLDVVEYEDMSRDGLGDSAEAWQRLLRSPRTVLTPHVAGWTEESKYKLAAVLADKIIAVLKSEKC